MIQIRMYSSRMRTVRCSHRHWEGGGRVSAQGGVCSGMSAQGGCLPRVGCLPRECLPGRGVCAEECLPGRGCLRRGVSAQRVSARHPPVERMTDSCKNITLSQVCCGR